MKKILISALIVLLLIMAYFAIFKGISIANFHLLSVEQISEENDKLTQEIAQTEILMNNDYQTKLSELRKSTAELMTSKEEYYDLADSSTEAEIRRANQVEEYTVEFLMTNLGRHATAKGVNLTYTPTSGTTGEANVNNISFTVVGSYNSVIEFITAVEDDSKLGFRIRNFKLIPGGGYLQATFLVTNVKIKQENVSSSNAQSSSTTSQQGSTTQNTTTSGNAAQNTTSQGNTTQNTTDQTNSTQNATTNSAT